MTAGAFGVPEHAKAAYAELQLAIGRAGWTPCQTQPDLWHGSPQEQKAAARACMDCPVFAACGRYASAADEVTATYAGRTAAERRERFRARNRTRGAAYAATRPPDHHPNHERHHP